MKKVKKIGYLSVPTSTTLKSLPELLSDFKITHEVNILLLDIKIIRKKHVDMVIYSDRRSWSQEYYPDGLIHCTIAEDESIDSEKGKV